MAADFFLDVERSVLGRHWRSRLNGAGEAAALAIAQVSGQSDLMARVLAGRGVKLEEVERYLDPTLRDLMPDPFTMRDMEPAVARLAYAVQRGEKVAIFGDYDVDGATSAALLAQYLNDCGCETIVHIPDRVIEGYGPKCGSDARLRRAGRQSRRHRRLRHRQP
jgi:single-stranded-DNA-specific exonuclease